MKHIINYILKNGVYCSRRTDLKTEWDEFYIFQKKQIRPQYHLSFFRKKFTKAGLFSIYPDVCIPLNVFFQWKCRGVDNCRVIRNVMSIMKFLSDAFSDNEIIFILDQWQVDLTLKVLSFGAQKDT